MLAFPGGFLQRERTFQGRLPGKGSAGSPDVLGGGTEFSTVRRRRLGESGERGIAQEVIDRRQQGGSRAFHGDPRTNSNRCSAHHPVRVLGLLSSTFRSSELDSSGCSRGIPDPKHICLLGCYWARSRQRSCCIGGSSWDLAENPIAGLCLTRIRFLLSVRSWTAPSLSSRAPAPILHGSRAGDA